MKITLKLGVLAVAALLLVAACGDTEPETASAPTTSAPVAVPDDTLPPNPAAGACSEGDPDCNDIPGLEPEPPILADEPDLGVDPGTGSSGFIVGGGLSVEEALGGNATGVIAVSGFVVSDASGHRLCDLLAESMPPQCGGASIDVANLDIVDPDELKSSQGVIWTDFPVTIVGEIVDGVLIPTPASA